MVTSTDGKPSQQLIITLVHRQNQVPFCQKAERKVHKSQLQSRKEGIKGNYLEVRLYLFKDIVNYDNMAIKKFSIEHLSDRY